MVDTILITLLIVAICIALLGINIFFIKGGKFPNEHVSGNKTLNKKVFPVYNCKTSRPD